MRYTAFAMPLVLVALFVFFFILEIEHAVCVRSLESGTKHEARTHQHLSCFAIKQLSTLLSYRQISLNQRCGRTN